MLPAKHCGDQVCVLTVAGIDAIVSPSVITGDDNLQAVTAMATAADRLLPSRPAAILSAPPHLPGVAMGVARSARPPASGAAAYPT